MKKIKLFFVFGAMFILLASVLLSVSVFAGEGGSAEDHTPSDPENMTVLTSANVNARKTVHLNVGEKVYYEGYSTNYFSVDGKMAYCLEPLKSTPSPGDYEIKELGNGKLRKVMYYVYGGPGYDTYVTHYGYLGYAAEFRLDSEYCMSHCILSFVYSGSADAFAGVSEDIVEALKWEIDRIMELPDPPDSFNAFTFNSGRDSQTMGGTGEDRTGTVEVKKSPDHPQWTEGNPCYSLKDAVFGIFREGEDEPAYKIRTDENGCGRLEDVPAGTYEIAELESPKGYALDGSRQKITVKADRVCTYRCQDQAQNHPAKILLKKTDHETGNSQAQGQATLAGAEFIVKYYAGYYESDPEQSGIQPERTWSLRTDGSGQLKFSDEFKTGGDEFYKNQEGENTLPLGTVTFQETKAPEGYLVNDTVFTEKITADGDEVFSTVFHSPAVPQSVIRGDIQIVKFREDVDEEEDQKTSLEGIIFTITSKTTGKQIQIATDENGYASTEQEGGSSRGTLPYDTYIVSEENTPQGLKPVDDFEVKITEEGKTLHYILENKQILSPVKLVKTDASTGETIPLAGARFQLLDSDMEPVEMKIHYPKETVHSIFSTDESGSFVLPEKLPAGVYYFREVQAPQGYLLSEELLKFEIIEGHDWEEPFAVEFENEPAKGRICITKTDALSGEGIAGTEFEIRAKEEIRTPDGTLRTKKGETVGTMISDENGTACSEELFLGQYQVLEIKQAPGYVKSEEKYDVDLNYKDQTTPVVTVDLKIENEPTTVTAEKKDKDTQAPLAGVEFALWQDGAEEEKETLLTDENGKAVFQHLSSGTYFLQETKGLDGYLPDSEIREFVVDEEGKIDGKGSIVFLVENAKTKITDTKALWKSNKIKTTEAGENTVVADTVSLENLIPGQEYRLVGRLADPETGEPLEESQAKIQEKTFQAQANAQEVVMEFEVDTREMEGKKIVVYETLYLGETEISAHEDPEDEGQAVEVKDRAPVAAKTGDSGDGVRVPALLMASFASLSAGAASVLCIRGKEKRRRKGRR